MGSVKQLINRARNTKESLERVFVNRDYTRDRLRDLRIKANLYGGIVAGVIAPIVGVRYTIFRDLGDTPLENAGAWVGSVLVNCFPLTPVPLVGYGFLGGTALGVTSAMQLREKYAKQDRKRRIKNRQENDVNNRPSNDLTTNIPDLS